MSNPTTPQAPCGKSQWCDKADGHKYMCSQRLRRCSVEGCGRAVEAKGLCKSHYHSRRRQATAEPAGEGPCDQSEWCTKRQGHARKCNSDLKPCSVEGCAKNVFTGGRCAQHRHQWEKYGSVTPPKDSPCDRTPNCRFTQGHPGNCRERAARCSAEGCTVLTAGGRLCPAHRQNMRTYGYVGFRRERTAGQIIKDTGFDTTPGSDCLLWRGARDGEGRAVINSKALGYHNEPLSRVLVRQAPPGLREQDSVEHTCGNKMCGNREHLKVREGAKRRVLSASEYIDEEVLPNLQQQGNCWKFSGPAPQARSDSRARVAMFKTAREEKLRKYQGVVAVCGTDHCVYPDHLAPLANYSDPRLGEYCQSGRHEVITTGVHRNPRGTRSCLPCLQESKYLGTIARRAKARKLKSDSYTIQQVLEKTVGLCHICTGPIDLEADRKKDPLSLQLDHVLPVSRGGHNTLDNVMPAHRYCNLKKHASMNYVHEGAPLGLEQVG